MGDAAISTQPAVIRALARVEGRRLLRHPAFVALGLLCVAAALAIRVRPRDPWADYGLMGGNPWVYVPLGWGLFAAAALGGSRSRRHGNEDLLSSAPITANARTLGHLASLAWPVAAALVVLGASGLGLQAWNGLPLPVVDPPPAAYTTYRPGDVGTTLVVPSPAEAAQIPLGLAAMGALGVVLAPRLRRGLVLVLVAPLAIVDLTIVQWGVNGAWRWFMPLVNSLRRVGWVEVMADGSGYDVVSGINVAATAAHDLYLVGVILVASAFALGASIRNNGGTFARRKTPHWVLSMAGLGVALALAGGIAQLLIYTPSL